MSQERFKCPECGGHTNVVWDPNQESREVDCIHCRRDVYDVKTVMGEDGKPVYSKGRKDAEGQPVPVTYNEVKQVGCRYRIERGKGVE